jgi:hypothetical protein
LWYDDNVNAAAKAIGMPQRTLADIVSGDVENPRANALQKLGEHFHVSLEWLLNGPGDWPEYQDTEPLLRQGSLSSAMTSWVRNMARLGEPLFYDVLEGVERPEDINIHKLQHATARFSRDFQKAWYVYLTTIADILGSEFISRYLAEVPEWVKAYGRISQDYADQAVSNAFKQALANPIPVPGGKTMADAQAAIDNYRKRRE